MPSQQPHKVGVISIILGKRKLKHKETAGRDITDGIPVIKAVLGFSRKTGMVECTHRYTNGKEPNSGIDSCEYEGWEVPNRPCAGWKPWDEGMMAEFRYRSL